MDPKAGLRIQDYELARLIGSGGMSQVWAARHVPTGRQVALKLLRGGEQLEELSRVRFTREAHATRTIGHPAIVPVEELLAHHGDPVLVMELLEGETLRARLERERQLSARGTAQLLLPVAEALSLAHAAGIVHRDLKPENVFVQHGTPETVRLLDFGVARFYEPPPGTEGAPTTALGALVGTLAYMAPEQALHPSDCDARVDVWALGVLLYEALAGCRPIEGTTEPETLKNLLLGAITPLEVLVPELPSELTRLVATMLVRKPEKRLPSVELVTRALRSVAEIG
jgi:eukaryotic-like serine/threonine-protein kinase